MGSFTSMFVSRSHASRDRRRRRIASPASIESLEGRVLLSHIAIESGEPLLQLAAESNATQAYAHGGVDDEISTSYNYPIVRPSPPGAPTPSRPGNVTLSGYQYLSDDYFGATDLYADGQIYAYPEGDWSYDSSSVTGYTHISTPINVNASFSDLQSIKLKVVPDFPGEIGLPVEISLRAFLQTGIPAAEFETLPARVPEPGRLHLAGAAANST